MFRGPVTSLADAARALSDILSVLMPPFGPSSAAALEKLALILDLVGDDFRHHHGRSSPHLRPASLRAASLGIADRPQIGRELVNQAGKYRFRFGAIFGWSAEDGVLFRKEYNGQRRQAVLGWIVNSSREPVHVASMICAERIGAVPKKRRLALLKFERRLSDAS